MAGGPSSQERDAAARQADLAKSQQQTGNEMLGLFKDQYAKITPFATSRLNNGLPYFSSALDSTSGTNARAFAPVRAQANRSQALFGDSLPSGFHDQTMTDINSAQAHSYDDELNALLQANDQAKVQAAGLLTGQQQLVQPQSYFSGAGNANQSILQAPLQRPGLGGLFAGLGTGILGALPV